MSHPKKINLYYCLHYINIYLYQQNMYIIMKIECPTIKHMCYLISKFTHRTNRDAQYIQYHLGLFLTAPHTRSRPRTGPCKNRPTTWITSVVHTCQQWSAWNRTIASDKRPGNLHREAPPWKTAAIQSAKSLNLRESTGHYCPKFHDKRENQPYKVDCGPTNLLSGRLNGCLQQRNPTLSPTSPIIGGINPSPPGWHRRRSHGPKTHQERDRCLWVSHTNGPQRQQSNFEPHPTNGVGGPIIPYQNRQWSHVGHQFWR